MCLLWQVRNVTDPESDLDAYYVSVRRLDGWVVLDEQRVGLRDTVALAVRGV